MSRRKVKMTTEGLVRRAMQMNFDMTHNRLWGKPECDACQRAVHAVRDATIDKYLAATPDEVDPLGTRHLIENSQTWAMMHSCVWMYDFLRGLELDTFPRCPACGWRWQNQTVSHDSQS